MNANIVRTLVLVSVGSAGVTHLGLRRMNDAERLTTPSLVHEASTDWALVRTAAKHRLADDVIARRRTLWDAAALFREINRHPQDAPACHPLNRGPGPMTFVARTDEERVVLQVISYVAARLHA